MTDEVKKQVQYIMAYLIEINLFSQNLIAAWLVKKDSLQIKVESAYSHIERINKAWNNIPLPLSMDISEEEQKTLLKDICTAKEMIFEDLSKKESFSKLKTILETQKKRLEILEDYINKPENF